MDNMSQMGDEIIEERDVDIIQMVKVCLYTMVIVDVLRLPFSHTVDIPL